MAIGNYVKPCAKNISGNSKLFYAETPNITSITVTAGEVSAVTMSGGTTFHEFQADSESIQFTHSGVGSTSYAMTQTLIAKFAKKTTTLITAVDSLVDALPCGVTAIRKDNNGQAFLSGWSENLLEEAAYKTIDNAYDSGTARADEDVQAYTVTLTANNDQDEIPFDSTLNAAIAAGTAVFITWN
jgi:hypothetical protein